MPRNRSFDEDVVLTAAMKCFWRRGFAATSMKDLEAATGLTTGSLYNGFGNKDELFLAALRHYVDTVVAARIARYLIAGNARSGILAFVREGLDRGSHQLSSGCLLVNSFVEAPLHRPEVRDVLSRGQRLIDEALVAAVDRGMAAGDIRAHPDSRALGLQVGFAAHALLVRSRAETAPNWFEESMSAIEALLPVAA